ncbi:hypothetical protein SLA2020_105780 [Shorea laevis]
MASFIINCWFIIGSVLIPHGFLKWFYLSFYIHPIFLVFCQIFLWLKLLLTWILYPCRIIWFMGSYAFKFSVNCGSSVLSFFRNLGNSSVESFEEEDLDVFEEAVDSFNGNHQLLSLHSCSGIPPIVCNQKGFDQLEKVEFGEESWCEYDGGCIEEGDPSTEGEIFCLQGNNFMDDEYCSVVISSCVPSSDDVNLNEYSSVFCGSGLPAQNPHLNEYSLSVVGSSKSSAVERKVTSVGGDEDSESEVFYKEYSSRMKWFDMLNHDRTCGLSGILSDEPKTPSSLESMKVKDFSVQFISGSRVTKKRLLRSIESDFELVYVAQSCLSWEALYHQYRKVKSLASSGSRNAVFQRDVAQEFQKFHVLLGRFVEDESITEGKRVWNYVRARSASKSLLQVPEASGFLEGEKEEMKGEAVTVKEVLEAIEQCIQTFWLYIKIDKKSTWWKLKSSRTYQPVEDPRDLGLLADLTRRLQNKELWLKDLQGKRKCWFNKIVKPVEEFQRKELLFTMIEMKLVSRVLQMSELSSSQLKWCQQKLDTIEFKEGMVFRDCPTAPLLFPS